MPGEHRSVVLTGPDNSIEILLRSGRIDRLLLSDSWETSFVAKSRLGELGHRVDALRAGDRILMDQPAVNTLRYLQAHPSADPLTSTVRGLAPLQRWALARIAKRFRLHPVAREQVYTVMELRS